MLPKLDFDRCNQKLFSAFPQYIIHSSLAHLATPKSIFILILFFLVCQQTKQGNSLLPFLFLSLKIKYLMKQGIYIIQFSFGAIT